MTFTDPIGDMFSRIRNGQSAEKASVTMPFSKMKLSICKVLENEGYIDSTDVSGEAKKELTVLLKYYEGKPVIENIKRISKPSLRRYSASSDIKSVKNGLGALIVTTNQGLMTDKQAKAKNVGGEVLCEVF